MLPLKGKPLRCLQKPRIHQQVHQLQITIIAATIFLTLTVLLHSLATLLPFSSSNNNNNNNSMLLLLLLHYLYNHSRIHRCIIMDSHCLLYLISRCLIRKPTISIRNISTLINIVYDNHKIFHYCSNKRR